MGIVSLRTVVAELDFMLEGSTAFLNRHTGEIVRATEEDLAAVDGDDEDLAEWGVEGVAKVREILDSDDWITLPDRFEVDEYRMMQRFALSVTDDKLGGELLQSINGRGAFRYFKDTLHRHKIQKEWYEFREQALTEVAASWLESNGITYEP